jgi:hypothetical protein
LRRATLKAGGTQQPRLPWRHFALNIISPSILTFALFLGLIFAVIVPTMKRNIVERKKEMIRELTQVAWSELSGLHEQERRGALTRSAAQQAAIARVQQLRFGDDGKDYFWICDMQPRMVMHPYRPEMVGQDLSGYSDPAGNLLFAEAAKVVRESGDGYLEYLWQWKDDAKRVGPKLSYVKGFAPWNWIVGTGVYLEDVRAEIGLMTRRVLQIDRHRGLAGLHHKAGARLGASPLAGGGCVEPIGGEIPVAGRRRDRGHSAGHAGPAGVRKQDAAGSFGLLGRGAGRAPAGSDTGIRSGAGCSVGTARQTHHQRRRSRECAVGRRADYPGRPQRPDSLPERPRIRWPVCWPSCRACCRWPRAPSRLRR